MLELVYTLTIEFSNVSDDDKPNIEWSLTVSILTFWIKIVAETKNKSLSRTKIGGNVSTVILQSWIAMKVSHKSGFESVKNVYYRYVRNNSFAAYININWFKTFTPQFSREDIQKESICSKFSFFIFQMDSL